MNIMCVRLPQMSLLSPSARVIPAMTRLIISPIEGMSEIKKRTVKMIKLGVPPLRYEINPKMIPKMIVTAISVISSWAICASMNV